MKHIHTFESFLNEGAKISPKDLTREGKELVNWLEKTLKTGTIHSISLKNNTAEVAFNENVDLTHDLFNMVREWPNAPAYMDLYVDVMSVNRGRLVMMIFGKPGLKFTNYVGESVNESRELTSSQLSNFY